MPDLQHLLVFVAAGWLLNLTPGPDVLYIVASSLRGGARAGIVAGLGITSGCFVHVVAAAIGVSALMATSALAFTVLKWLGAAYLLWVGVQLLLARADGADVDDLVRDARPVSLREVYVGGFWTNVLNPKVAIFFLAFVPQFIVPGDGHESLSFVLLGILFNINSIPVNAGWAIAAAWIARQGAIRQWMHWLDRAAGAMFIAFGLRLALADTPSR